MTFGFKNGYFTNNHRVALLVNENHVQFMEQRIFLYYNDHTSTLLLFLYNNIYDSHMDYTMVELLRKTLEAMVQQLT